MPTPEDHLSALQAHLRKHYGVKVLDSRLVGSEYNMPAEWLGTESYPAITKGLRFRLAVSEELLTNFDETEAVLGAFEYDSMVTLLKTLDADEADIAVDGKGKAHLRPKANPRSKPEPSSPSPWLVAMLGLALAALAYRTHPLLFWGLVAAGVVAVVASSRNKPDQDQQP